jgi:hypothetical protein
MERIDEALLHAFYAGDKTALKQLAERMNPTLASIVNVILQMRTGSANLQEWDVNDRLISLWTHVKSTSLKSAGYWPSERLSASTWLIHLLCIEMDRHLEFNGPY